MLQKPIDAPVWSLPTLTAAEQAGLALHHLETYSVWTEGDYQVMLFRHRADAAQFTGEGL